VLDPGLHPRHATFCLRFEARAYILDQNPFFGTISTYPRAGLHHRPANFIMALSMISECVSPVRFFSRFNINWAFSDIMAATCFLPWRCWWSRHRFCRSRSVCLRCAKVVIDTCLLYLSAVIYNVMQYAYINDIRSKVKSWGPFSQSAVRSVGPSA